MSEINTEIVGKIIEGYKVVKPLGQGKFSTVYQAERLTDQKLVALKIIKVFIEKQILFFSK
jgi:serine/threonine protein kinase